MGDFVGSILKHIFWEIVLEGIWKVLCLLVKGWGHLWFAFYNLFLCNRPDLVQILGITSALVINPITLSILIAYWPEMAAIAQEIGAGTLAQ
ncbi:hypothetical protein [Kiloniella sp.]|uniref:hypothetical protein n=1 Tax=Kiloniella sp. TaxID=1938587 RepID=UPI003B02A17F